MIIKDLKSLVAIKAQTVGWDMKRYSQVHCSNASANAKWKGEMQRLNTMQPRTRVPTYIAERHFAFRAFASFYSAKGFTSSPRMKRKFFRREIAQLR